jgi:hypothetical protein
MAHGLRVHNMAATRDQVLAMAIRPVAAQLTYEDLLQLARRYERQTLETVTGTKFRVGIYLDCPFFTPASTGLGRSDGRAAAERFVARYNETGSLRPGDYAGITRNASYLVALLRLRSPDRAG